jgi:hypothetical protein
MAAIFPTYLINCPARKEVKAEYYKLIEKLSGEEDGKEYGKNKSRINNKRGQFI